MKIEANIEKKYFFGLLALSLIVLGIVGVIAYGTSSPSTFGHSVGEIDWEDTIQGQVKARDGFCIDTECVDDWGGAGGGSGCATEFCVRDGTPASNPTSWGAWSCTSDGVSFSATNLASNNVRQHIIKCKNDPWLYNSHHTVQSCTGAGGTSLEISNNKLCQFSNPSSTSPPTNYCPAGWKQYRNWSETSARTCTGTDSSGCTGAASCSVTGHTWGDSAPEYCSYRNTANWGDGCQYMNAICFNVTKIACY